MGLFGIRTRCITRRQGSTDLVFCNLARRFDREPILAVIVSSPKHSWIPLLYEYTSALPQNPLWTDRDVRTFWI
jgi:hypothetical protein